MQELIALLERDFGLRVDVDTALVSSGLIDSLRFLDLLEALERDHGVTIDAAEVGMDNFDTPAQMLAYVRALAA